MDTSHKIDIISNDNVVYNLYNIKDSEYLKIIQQCYDDNDTSENISEPVYLNFSSDTLLQLADYLNNDIQPKNITPEIISLSHFLILPSLIKDVVKRLQPNLDISYLYRNGNFETIDILVEHDDKMDIYRTKNRVVVDCYRSNDRDLINYIENRYSNLSTLTWIRFYSHALAGACLNNNEELMEYLIKNRSDNIRLNICLYLVCELGSIENIETILKLDTTNIIDISCILSASKRQDMEVLEYLISLYCKKNKNTKNTNQDLGIGIYNRMFLDACFSGNLELVVYILKKNPMSELIYSYTNRIDDKDGFYYYNTTFILYALYGKNIDILKVLLDNLIIDKKSPIYGYLKHCIKTKKIDIYKYYVLSTGNIKNVIFYNSVGKFPNLCLANKILEHTKIKDKTLDKFKFEMTNYNYTKNYYEKIYSGWVNTEYKHTLSDPVKSWLYEYLLQKE